MHHVFPFANEKIAPMRHLLTKILLGFAVVLAATFALGSTSSAQDETTTTQLDVGGDETGETTTTQLDVGGGQATTTTQLEATTAPPPNRIEAGAGGTASGATTPLALVALAGGLIVVTMAAARKVRTEHS